MNKTTTRQLVACAAGLVIGTQAFGWNPFASEVTLAENGVAKAQIVLAEHPTSVAQYGALDLQRHLKVITGADFAIVSEKEQKEGLYPICIGFGADVSELGRQEYVVDIGRDRLVLCGVDSPRTNTVKIAYGEGVIVTDHWNDPVKFTTRGSLNAVYDFLGETVGVKWLDASDYGTILPKLPTLKVKTTSRKVQPFAFCRDFEANPEQWSRDKRQTARHSGLKPYWDACFPTAQKIDRPPADRAKRRAKEAWLLRVRAGGEKLHANHSFYWCYDRFWEKDSKNGRFIAYHPEYFAKYRKRRAKSATDAKAGNEIMSEFDTERKPGQMCFTNPGFFQQTLVDIRAYFDAGGYTNRYMNQAQPASAAHPVPSWGKDTYCLEPMDNAAFCECDECMKWYEPERKKESSQHSTYVFRFVNEVAKEIRKTHPKCKISTLAYMTHSGMPTGFKLEDNVVVHFCWSGNRQPHKVKWNQLQMDLIRSWREAYPKNPFGVWLYNGFPNESSTWYHYMNFPGFFSRRFEEEMHYLKEMDLRECIFNCGLNDEFESYCFARWSWNPDEPLAKIKDEFFASYGPAEKPIRAFYDLVQDRYLDRANWHGYEQHMNKQYAWGYLGTEEVMDRLGELMAEAENAPGLTELERGRVLMWRRAVYDYMYLAKYNRADVPSHKEGVTIESTCWCGAKAKGFDGKSQIEGRPFEMVYAPKEPHASYLGGEKNVDLKAIDLFTRPTNYYARGFFDGWGKTTNFLLRCKGPVENMKRFRISTDVNGSRIRLDTTIVGWQGDRMIELYANNVISNPPCFFPPKGTPSGVTTYDFRFAPGTVPAHLDAVGILDRTQEHKGWLGPRYYRFEVE